MEHLPLGRVLDQIACWQISECGVQERRTVKGSLMAQMDRFYGK